ncbi:MAG: response regulator [Holophagaceae bacterium]|nr:response regulator [Holophagaceae bacterium]
MAKHILVVDDEPFTIQILTLRLVANGYLVDSASDGADMLAKLADFKPDAILLDVMMPRIDGTQLADLLGQMPDLADIPIIFHSALISPDLPQDSPVNPHHHYLSKTAEPEVLLALLKRIGV